MWQGVLHCAVVSADEGSRIINSTCVAPAGFGDSEPVGESQIAEFLESDRVAGSYT